MRRMKIVDPKDFAYNFIESEFLPEGKDEYYLRNSQVPKKNYRKLKYDEVEALIKNGNSCTNWDDLLVEEPFNPSLLKNNIFAGLVRLGKMESGYLQYHDYVVPIGITNSKIVSSDIFDNCAIHDCAYISHYIIGERVILSRVDEMSTTNHSKFGNGIIKQGENESVRISISTINEMGGREILPFENMIVADAFLWARYREDSTLIKKLEQITQNSVDNYRGYYGFVGNECCIKSTRIIKDVNFGECVYVKGANKLKNLTIKSSVEESTQIGEGVELVNGIVGLGSRIFYGVKAVRFVTGANCELKYGARLIHSILGDNSTISCCEVLNSLIFPFHEQHHNNSFLIASLLQGQTNIAAGATLGSNHNTRGNDGEMVAGRGFWPGLCTTIKHNSKFASFVLLSKANYAYELNIVFPFSLVINSESKNELQIMPAYFWMYNMYALERNNKKFIKRDRRITKTQIIETDYLAPDTVREIIEAMKILETKIVKAWKEKTGGSLTITEILKEHFDEAQMLEIYCDNLNIERSTRKVKILKPVKAFKAYRQMLVWYGVKTLTDYFESTKKNLSEFQKISFDDTSEEWTNLGGQIVLEKRISLLRKEIVEDKLKNWDDIHKAYDKIHEHYLEDRAKNAYATLLFISKEKNISKSLWAEFINEACDICDYIAEQIYFTKNKDYTDHFRSITYRNKKEQDAVLVPVQKNELVKNAKPEAEIRKSFLKKFIDF